MGLRVAKLKRECPHQDGRILHIPLPQLIFMESLLWTRHHCQGPEHEDKISHSLCHAGTHRLLGGRGQSKKIIWSIDNCPIRDSQQHRLQRTW